MGFQMGVILYSGSSASRTQTSLSLSLPPSLPLSLSPSLSPSPPLSLFPSLFLDENVRAKEVGKGTKGEMYPSHGPLRFITSHSRFSLVIIICYS